MNAGATDIQAGEDWANIRAQLIANPEQVLNDDSLLQALGLKIANSNVVEFGPAALTRLETARIREMTARQEIEAVARANFAAQAQTHAMAVDLLEARNNSDLARRVHEGGQRRFSVVAGAADWFMYSMISGRMRRFGGSILTSIKVGRPFIASSASRRMGMREPSGRRNPRSSTKLISAMYLGEPHIRSSVLS